MELFAPIFLKLADSPYAGYYHLANLAPHRWKRSPRHEPL